MMPVLTFPSIQPDCKTSLLITVQGLREQYREAYGNTADIRYFMLADSFRTWEDILLYSFREEDGFRLIKYLELLKANPLHLPDERRCRFAEQGIVTEEFIDIINLKN